MAIETAVLSPALMSASLEEVKRRNGEPPWSARVVINDEFTISAICQPSGFECDRHYHYKEECWFIAEGEIIWNMGDDVRIHAKAGDFVLAPKNTWHLIEPVGDGPSIRVAVSVTGEPHRHDPDAI
ncbi:MAG: cupin domain-containing protein [Chloroflexi bacterium]|nr:cupin domain-containing protein [Chloroflexota bacterium]MCY3938798.1 cupin domain-containing protein [Chloroflexota bacterium]